MKAYQVTLTSVQEPSQVVPNHACLDLRIHAQDAQHFLEHGNVEQALWCIKAMRRLIERHADV